MSKLEKIKTLLLERDSFIVDGFVEDYPNYDERIYLLNDEGHIDWLVERVDYLEEWQEHSHQRRLKLIEVNAQLEKRVEELEKENEELKEINKANYWAGNTIKFENQRYKQALEAIAAGDNHVAEFWDIAKWALEGDSNE